MCVFTNKVLRILSCVVTVIEIIQHYIGVRSRMAQSLDLPYPNLPPEILPEDGLASSGLQQLKNGTHRNSSQWYLPFCWESC